MCDLHTAERRRRFCKEPGCWERLCTVCARERHAGHNVADYFAVLAEVRVGREKNALAKMKLLAEVKKTLQQLEYIQKNMKDKVARARAKQKRHRMQVELQLKSFGQAMSSQQDKVQEMLDVATEDIKTKKSELIKNIEEADRIAEQAILKGDGYEIKEFFDKCGKIYSMNTAVLDEIIESVQKEVDEFQELERNLFSNEVSNGQAMFSPRGVTSSQLNNEEVKKAFVSASQNKAKKVQARTRNNDTIASMILRLTNLGSVKSRSPSRDKAEDRHENLKRSLNKILLQIKEKTVTLEKLEGLINSKNESLAILENKKEQLIRTNSTLKEQLESQNRAFEYSAKTLNPSRTLKQLTICSPVSSHPVLESAKSALQLKRTSTEVPALELSLAQGEGVRKITQDLRNLLRKYSSSTRSLSSKVTAEIAIKEIDSYWSKLNSRGRSKPAKSPRGVSKEPSKIDFTKEKKVLEQKVESAQTELE